MDAFSQNCFLCLLCRKTNASLVLYNLKKNRPFNEITSYMFYTYLASSSVVQYLGEKQVHFGSTPQEQVKNDRSSLGFV